MTKCANVLERVRGIVNELVGLNADDYLGLEGASAASGGAHIENADGASGAEYFETADKASLAEHSRSANEASVAAHSENTAVASRDGTNWFRSIAEFIVQHGHSGAYDIGVTCVLRDVEDAPEGIEEMVTFSANSEFNPFIVHVQIRIPFKNGNTVASFETGVLVRAVQGTRT
ncbi:hypothetical protein K458DRAFT_395681 [Lentithecium fluviatile CBS 122367]|uniref:Uncharacterized protein n=1 Tax=Lentithecium fluviatile CBS 122367 TaxID=1168545 RepID=A0A6G1IIE9_9PLEO|nr:hypothetical protein K458DRAFT_395681 [Lentithecium fluviatile CBS 122367]